MVGPRYQCLKTGHVMLLAGAYLFGATLLYKVNSSTTERMRARLVLNGTSEKGIETGSDARSGFASWID